MKNSFLSLFLFLFSTPVFAFPALIDSDADGVPDGMEFWLRANGIAVSETVFDTYIDTDSDGVPDLVEDNISRTDKNIDESSVATAIAGFALANNSGEIAGQWDTCVHVNATDVAGDIGTPDECESVYTAITFVGFSIMHSSTDQTKSYIPNSGYADSESYNSATNAYSATFSSTDGAGILTTLVINGTFDGVNGLTGSVAITEDGVPIPGSPLPIASRRRAAGWTGTGDPSGIYALQETVIDQNTGFPFTRAFNFTPGNFAGQLSFSGAEVIFYAEEGSQEPFGFFYIPALGLVIDVSANTYLEDLDDDDAIDDTSYEIESVSIMVLALPAGNNTGLLRGAFEALDYDDINSDQSLTNGLPTGLLDDTIVPGVGDDIFFEEGLFYGRHHEPRVGTFTRNTTAGFSSRISLNNIPFAASQITVSGPSGFVTTDVVNESGGTSMMDAVSIRNRANPESRDDGFVALQVGISGSDKHNVSNLSHRSAKTLSVANLFPSGTYTFSTGVAGTFNDPRNTASVTASYTQPVNAAAVLDVANPEPMTRQIGSGPVIALNPGVPLNRYVLNAKANGGAGNPFDVTQPLTLNWQAVAGADSYVVRITCLESPQNDCDEIDALFLFTSGTSATIPAYTLFSFTEYRINIEARNIDGSLRSLTTGIAINDTNQDQLIPTNTLTEGPGVVGWSNVGSGTSFEAIHRPGDVSGSGSGSGVGFILMHGRCAIAEGSVVSSLRRSIANAGYDTVSIRTPANVSTAENICDSSTTSFADFETGAAYVVPEAVARVRQAMNELLAANASINRVVLVGFGLGTRLATAAIAPSNHLLATPLPIVGLVLTGTRSGSTATTLDTTTALGEITVPVLDFYMNEDSPAVSTAAARVAAYAGNPSDYTQTVLAVNDNWGLVDGATSNIGNPRQRFLGYESDLRDTVSQWIAATSTSSVVASVLPVSRSVPVATTATAFASIINFGANPATGCSIEPLTAIPATFSYQTTDPATNAVTGTPDTPVDIAAGATQTFVFAITPTAPIAPTDVEMTFKCLNTAPAPIFVGSAVNTLLFSASATPIPDVIAQGATVGNTGIVDIPGNNGNSLFAAGTSNVGVTGDITISADTGNASLPLVLNVCETDPGSGACISAIQPTLTVTYGGASNRSFAIFVSGTGNVPFDPANNRVIVRFKDSGGVTRGATSVAVRTQ